MCEVHKTPEEILANKKRYEQITYEKHPSPAPRLFEEHPAITLRNKCIKRRLLSLLAQSIIQNNKLHNEILSGFVTSPETWTDVDPDRLTDLEYLKSLIKDN